MTPADLYEIRKVVVAMHALTSGEFDQEIARMETASKATVEQATAEASKIMARANEALDVVQTKSKALMDAATEAREQLARDRVKFDEAKAANELQQEERLAQLREVQKEVDADRAANQALLDELAPRMAEVARKESNLEAQLARASDLQAELTDKLSAIRRLSA